MNYYHYFIRNIIKTVSSDYALIHYSLWYLCAVGCVMNMICNWINHDNKTFLRDECIFQLHENFVHYLFCAYFGNEIQNID